MLIRMPQNLLQQAVQQVNPEKLKSTMCVFGQTLTTKKLILDAWFLWQEIPVQRAKNLARTRLFCYSVFTRRLILKRQILPLHLSRSAITQTWKFFWNWQQVNRFAFNKIHTAYLCHYTTTEKSVFVGKTGLYWCQVCWRKILRQFSVSDVLRKNSFSLIAKTTQSTFFVEEESRITYSLSGNCTGFSGRLHSCL